MTADKFLTVSWSLVQNGVLILRFVMIASEQLLTFMIIQGQQLNHEVFCKTRVNLIDK